MNHQDTTKELCFDPESIKDNQDPVLGKSGEDKLGTGEIGNISEDKHSIFLKKAGIGLGEAGTASSSKCRRTCLILYSALATIIILILSILLLKRDDTNKSDIYLEHNDASLSELSKVLIPPFNARNDTVNDDENNRNLLLPAICNGDWFLDHEVWYNHWARHRVSATHFNKLHAKGKIDLQCRYTWQTCFYGPIVEASIEMARQLANDVEHGGYWECNQAYHIAAFHKNQNHVSEIWCDAKLKPTFWAIWEYTCYADCYADCHYVHECTRMSC